MRTTLTRPSFVQLLPILFFLLAAIPAGAIGILLTHSAWERELQTVQEQHLQIARNLDVHFVNPSPVFCLDNTGDDGHPHTIRYGYLAWLQTRITSMPVPYAPPVTLADEERRQLEALARAHATPQALAFRCRLILRTAAPDRPPNLRVAVELHCDRHTVRLWRTRYLAQGLAGLQDAPRTGRPRRISPL